ncbi:hypothetical protein AB3X52_04605 [Nocardioides sp. DS6]|uniref:Uncharacterized protein n=1 Tax=Nocardioides eburneus TaxID=3231482 RepID=A0ABV3SVC7_9ACTN
MRASMTTPPRLGNTEPEPPDHRCARCGVLDLTDRARAAGLGLFCSARHCAARDLGLAR